MHAMQTAPEQVVDIADVHFAYEALPLLQGLNLTIARGKITAILGVSGCGKTTLMRLIGGQLTPERGRVAVFGKTVHELDHAALFRLRRKMGLMPQRSGLFSDLSVFENVAFPMRELTNLPEPIIRDLVMMKLYAVGLEGASRKMPSELSGGMERRVALARAVALDPQLVMYDEPFAGLDPISLNVIATLIRRLNDATGMTAILVTYDVAEALKTADYFYFISQGKVAGHGTLAEVQASNNPFVHQMIHGEADGPIGFHMPAKPMREDLRMQADSASLS
jgi:phospholipid/cholesterol/gamma-HCH transport system ATP-binding protein